MVESRQSRRLTRHSRGCRRCEGCLDAKHASTTCMKERTAVFLTKRPDVLLASAQILLKFDLSHSLFQVSSVLATSTSDGGANIVRTAGSGLATLGQKLQAAAPGGSPPDAAANLDNEVSDAAVC